MMLNINYIMLEYPSGDGAVLIKQLPWVRFPPLVFKLKAVTAKFTRN